MLVSSSEEKWRGYPKSEESTYFFAFNMPKGQLLSTLTAVVFRGVSDFRTPQECLSSCLDHVLPFGLVMCSRAFIKIFLTVVVDLRMQREIIHPYLNGTVVCATF